MKNQRFRDLPIREIVPLHFVPDEKQLEDWLNSLPALDPALAAEKILQAIDAFNQADIKIALKIKLLDKIRQFFPLIVKTLQKTYIDSSLPLDNQATRNVELIVWTFMHLARSLRQCKLKSGNLNKKQQAGLLYLSLDALLQALLHISLSYKLPMHGFWAICYELYARAEQANLTDILITWNGRSNESITKLFKHLLIFNLCDTQQFRCRDILMLFNYLSDASAAARILANYQEKWQPVVCMFNLNQDLPPQKINPADVRDDLSERFITTVSIAKNMYDSLQQTLNASEQSFGDNAIRSINHEAFLRALNNLGLARKRKFTRISEQAKFKGIVGLKNLIDYLQSQSKNKTIAEGAIKTKPDSGLFNNAQKTQFDLIPIGEEIAYQMRNAVKHELKHELKQNEPLTKLFNFEPEQPTHTATAQPPNAPHTTKTVVSQFEMQDSCAKGYGLIAKLPTTQVKIGDIIAIIIHKSERTEVGLIRRINQLPDQQLHLGVEVISFESELVFVSNPLQPTQGFWAIFLPGVKSLKQLDSLIYNNSAFKQGDTVNIRGKQNHLQFRLNKTLQISAAVTHMELLKLSEINE